MTTPPNPAQAAAEQAERSLFHEAVSCELSLPIEFQPGSSVPRLSATQLTLHALSQVEELRENLGDNDRSSHALQRVDAKLDLLLILVARMVRTHESPLPLRPVRWSRNGLRLEVGQRGRVAIGSAGIVSLQPADWLPETIEFPVTVLAESDNGSGGFFLWLRFGELGATLDAALERHLFRLHRRQTAHARRTRE